MYTGIVQGVGRIAALTPTVSGLHIALRFPTALLRDLQIGASVSVDGVCLSVVIIDDNLISFDAINATLDRTNLGDRRVGDVVNLERSARQGDENGGHRLALVTAERRRAGRVGTELQFCAAAPAKVSAPTSIFPCRSAPPILRRMKRR